ncbi:MAG: tRNA epoxyqueuosine(34) reductase QueG [Planctomycetaceae bacterium]
MTAELADQIRSAGRDIGFDRIGIAAAVTPPGFHPLLEWLANGYAADMDWIERRRDAYEHPAGVMPGTRSVIVAAMNYHSREPEQHDETPGSSNPSHTATTGSESRRTEGATGRVSRYAWGSQDYHSVLRRRLKQLANVVHESAPDAHTRVVVDTAPLLERDFARLAGIGWFGKNTMLISRDIGSWFFLGAILTDLDLPADEPYADDFCGTCTRCLEACPTDAFPKPGVLDANRCISYLTIERRDKPIPPELRSGMGQWIFGCDICQDVCPWNRFAPATSDAAFVACPDLRSPDCVELLTLSEDQFVERFRGTPLQRTGRDAILRNAAIALGNSGVVSAIAQLRRSLSAESPLVREAAEWALHRIISGADSAK